MKSKLVALGLIVAFVAFAAAPVAAAPEAGPCVAGGGYSPACDVNQDGQIAIADIQLTAGHWNQTGTFTSDNNHNHLGQTWTGNNNPLKIQGAFGSPDYAPLVLSNSAGHGLSIPTASVDGIYVSSAGAYGMVVNHASQDGVYVGTAGNPSTNTASTDSNGFEIAGAQGHGLYVGQADRHGVYVNSAQAAGVAVSSAGTFGVSIYSAGVDGVSVSLAAYDGVIAHTTQASGQWGFYTFDAIHGSNVLMHSLSLVAQVTGPDGLDAGDIVAVAGVADPVPGSTVHTPLVRLAGGTFSNIVGVVESRLALTQQPSHPQPATGERSAEASSSELRSAEGPAQAGDYVAITVMGAAQVKVQDGQTIQVGQRLTVAANGRTRPLGMIKVQLAGGEGTADIAESAPVIGVALEAVTKSRSEAERKDGKVWVLVNPQ